MDWGRGQEPPLPLGGDGVVGGAAGVKGLTGDTGCAGPVVSTTGATEPGLLFALSAQQHTTQVSLESLSNIRGSRSKYISNSTSWT